MPFEGYSLDYLEAFALCYAAGFRFMNLVRAVAVMSAESGRWDRAYHINANGTVDRGLFQINGPPMISDAVAENYFDQMKNAQRAYAIWYERGWSPWAAWKHKKAQALMPGLLRFMLKPWSFKRLIPDIPFGP